MIIIKELIPCLILSLGTGGLAGLIISGDIYFYRTLDKPPLSPIPIVFTIVWVTLYLLMGISHYIVHISASPKRKAAIKTYYIQLLLSFAWPIIFFKVKALFVSVICIAVLLIFVLKTARSFYEVKPIAGKLLIPYVAWIIFASYLNIGVWVLN